MDVEAHEFSADFEGCTEAVGFVPVAFEEARALVPDELTLARDDAGQATLIARAVQCAAVSINGGASQPTTFAHIG